MLPALDHWSDILDERRFARTTSEKPLWRIPTRPAFISHARTLEKLSLLICFNHVHYTEKGQGLLANCVVEGASIHLSKNWEELLGQSVRVLLEP